MGTPEEISGFRENLESGGSRGLLIQVETPEVLNTLLIEDDPIYVAFVREILASAQDVRFILNTGNSLQEGISRLEAAVAGSNGNGRNGKTGIDVVILDLNLPDSRAMETFERIQPYLARHPIVILTGEEDVELALMAVREGAQDYLVKSELDRKVFLRALRYAVERKRYRDAQRESEALYSAMLEHAHDGIVIVQDEILKYANSTMANATGYRLEEILGKSFMDFIASEDQPRVAEMHKRRLDGLEVSSCYETEILARDGSVHPMELSVSTIDYQGLPAYLVILRNLTERRGLLNDLSEKTQWCDLILQKTGEGFLRMDLEGRIQEANPAFCDMLGYSKNELCKMNIADLEAVEDPEAVQRHVQRLIESGFDRFETRHVCKDGRIIDLEVSANFVNLGAQKFISSFFRDATERKQAQKRMRLLYQALEQAPSIIVVTDTQGRVEYVNSAFTRISGYSMQEMMGENIHILKSGEMKAEVFQHLWQTIQEGKEWQGVFPNLKKDGTLFWQSSLIFPIRDSSGKITNYLSVGEDITQLRSLQEELVQKSRLAAVGEASANLAHCMKNITSSILNGVRLVEEAVERGETQMFYQAIQILRRASTREYLVLMNMLDLSHEREVSRDSVQMETLFSEVQEMLRCCVRDREIYMDYKVDSPAKSLRLDSERLFRTLLNLGSNSIDAMPEGGSLSFRAFIKEKEPNNESAEGDMDKANNKIAVIEVEDTGVGIPPEHMGDLFKAYYTTKGSRGTGLGLASVKQYVEEQGGEIQVESNPGMGTTFRMMFACDELPAGAAGGGN